VVKYDGGGVQGSAGGPARLHGCHYVTGQRLFLVVAVVAK
jgi:hypothetical protein